MRTAGEILLKTARGVVSVSPETSVYDALARMAEENIGAVAVLERGELVGIFSERDYARNIVLKGRSSTSTSVAQVMARDVITINASASLTDCMEAMSAHKIRHLPVLEASTLLGVLSIGEVVRHVIEEQRQLIEQLESYIRG
ncbi:MAG: CBS domain-containing protein [Gammaproteobacteria bacterium]|nr:CBS domain-containing protein [Gammaproteobacteria bacterium]